MYDLSKLDIQTLLTYRANAAKTGRACMGHGKASRNDALFKTYTEELNARGFTEYGSGYEAYNAAAESGLFNGKGSS